MTLIIESENPAERAPKMFFNHCGLLSWSGRHQSEFTGLQTVELLTFCEHEGKRRGRLDAMQDRAGAAADSPFHPDFMGGYPRNIWEQAYWAGVHTQSNHTLESIDAEIQAVLNDPASSTWLRNAISTAISLDPVDALNDAEYLADLLDRRCCARALDIPDPMEPETLF